MKCSVSITIKAIDKNISLGSDVLCLGYYALYNIWVLHHEHWASEPDNNMFLSTAPDVTEVVSVDILSCILNCLVRKIYKVTKFVWMNTNTIP